MKPEHRISVIVVVLAAVGLWLIHASPAEDDDVNLARLPIQHSKDDGDSLWYQAVGFKNATLRFNETKGTFSEHGELIDYTMWRGDQGKLDHLRFVLRAEPAKWRPAPPGSQAVRLPDSRYTVYEDLDGDSALDTMVKVGPDSMSSFILFENTWIEVGNSMAKWESRRTVRAIDGGRQYHFAIGGWQRGSAEGVAR
jgi:hypothetical protein